MGAAVVSDTCHNQDRQKQRRTSQAERGKRAITPEARPPPVNGRAPDAVYLVDAPGEAPHGSQVRDRFELVLGVAVDRAGDGEPHRRPRHPPRLFPVLLEQVAGQRASETWRETFSTIDNIKITM